MSFNFKVFRKWMRLIHRDLGFLMVGFCLVYAVSGILLNHMNGKDPAYKSTEVTLQFDRGLTRNELTDLWNEKGSLPPLKKVLHVNDTHIRLMLDGGIGSYDASTGEIVYEHHTKRQVVYWINKLHYNKINGWYIMADLFAGSLIFLAISGLFMVSRKYAISGRGKWYLIGGVAIPIVYILLS